MDKLQSCWSAQLLAEEMMEERSKSSKPKSIPGIVSAILNNIQVTIRNIHIRYENEAVNSCVGLTISNITINSTGKDGKEVIYKEDELQIMKKCCISDVAIYCQSLTPAVHQMQQDQQKQYLKDTISSKEQPNNSFNYIL